MGQTKDAAPRLEGLLWPFVEKVVRSWDLPGVAVCVVRDGARIEARGFGHRDRATGRPVTATTPFHLASVSKTFVATAALQLVEEGRLELDVGIKSYLPDLPWADPRAARITLRHLLSHQSGIGDVADYGWHAPELDEDALSRFAAQVAGWPLEHDPGERFAYSNSAYELLGHLLAVVGGDSFEHLLKRRVLEPIGMSTSTFLREDVPSGEGAQPHLGLPARVVGGAYPYTRQHAPSSSLHSSSTEMGRWMSAHLAAGKGLLSPATHEVMWRPQAEPGWDDWATQMALGWFRGTYRGHRVVSHSGADPGFESALVLLPELGLGVTVLANSNTAPMRTLTAAALDVLLHHEPSPPPPPPVTVALAPVFNTAGASAAADLYRRLATADPPTLDLEQDGLEDAVWGLVEMHRTDLAWPLLDLWRTIRPESSSACFMAGWAHATDSRHARAIELLQRAVALDPDNADAATMLRRLTKKRT